MRIVTRYTTTASGAGRIVAKGIGGKQKTSAYDDALSIDQNHGRAAGALIQHVHAGKHPLTQQNGDDIRSAAVRSIDGGYSTHKVQEDGSHLFDV